jgi:hypothetical protein
MVYSDKNEELRQQHMEELFSLFSHAYIAANKGTNSQTNKQTNKYNITIISKQNELFFILHLFFTSKRRIKFSI